MKKRMLSVLMALVLILALVPFGAAAADQPVRVIAQNETFTETFNGVAPAWTGVLFDTTVAYAKGMTMQDALAQAALNEGVALTMTESTYGAYLTGVGGLMDSDYHSVDVEKDFDDPARYTTLGAWMATLNDWFTDTGMSAAAVEPGDTICVQYTTSWGADIGGDWNSTDGSLKRLNFSVGALFPAFDPAVTRYSLRLPQGVDSVTVTPEAVNKNNKVTVRASNTEEDARWGARTVFVGDSDITVSVANGTTYSISVSVGGDAHRCTAFKDLANDWSRSGICWAVENGVMNGMDKTVFQPATATTRAQLATVLYRLNGAEKNPKSAGFSDVAAGSWYADAVNWAAANKVVTGYEDNTFRPDQPVTRQEAATMLYRYRADSGKITETLAGFTDVSDVQSWAKDAFCWAVQNGIITGMSADTLVPNGTATRAQLATILWRTFGASDSALDQAKVYLLNQVSTPAPGDEWVVMDFARAGGWTTPGFADYYGKAEALAKSTKGGMNASYPTDHARCVLALTALGYDASNVGGYDLTKPLQDAASLAKQGTNALIFALLALDSGSYASDAREAIIDGILAAQKPDGGFTYDPKYDSDPDLTAMAIQALAPYMRSQQKAGLAVESALMCLSKMQQADGGFTAWGESSCESTAQAILALNAAGIDLQSEYFVKNGHSLLDNLMSFQQSNGGFAHKQGDAASAYTTEQALRALVTVEVLAPMGMTFYGVR